ncbi:uncharacterized protein MKK02DRAFT_43610 [Dioszegia hungarica]|uniref:EamA domain-containing protein n=1 Tax=Dioszegia hungarica TaxID=4972 RepID=A0AA38HED1_9TREE|nr:uncharacterized protein MKK02DRAFT_43610 [Dioszegia hungarica]KAI9637684.1 hypothetical protein MKK02DRAFT_43610 [Dioszegia hungarica]
MSSLIQRYSGALLALMASLTFTIMDAVAQNCMRRGLSPGQVIFCRALGTVPLLTLHVHMRQPSTFAQLDPRTRVTSDDESNDGTLLQRRPALAARLIWVRSVLTSVGLCLAFASMDRIAITELITVFSSRAYLIGILCWIFLKEVFGWRLRVAAVTCGFAVILVVQPPFIFGNGVSEDQASRTTGFLFSLAFLGVTTVEVVVLRYLGPGPDPLIMTLAYLITCLLVSPCFILSTGEQLGSILDWQICLDIVILAVLGLIGQMSVVLATQQGTGATVSVAMYAQVPLAVLIQSIFIGEPPGILQILGMATIVGFGVWAIVAESNEREQAKEASAEEEGGYALLPPGSEDAIVTCSGSRVAK